MRAFGARFFTEGLQSRLRAVGACATFACGFFLSHLP